MKGKVSNQGLELLMRELVARDWFLPADINKFAPGAKKPMSKYLLTNI